jgi:hypothetical protein
MKNMGRTLRPIRDLIHERDTSAQVCLILWLRLAIHIPDALIYYVVRVRTDSTDVALVLNPPAQKSFYQKQHPLSSLPSPPLTRRLT